MAIITPQTYAEWRNVTLEGDELASVTVICAQVDKAIKNKLKRTLEQDDFSIIIDAPTTPCFSIARYAPITIASVDLRLNTAANGDPTQFDTTTQLELYSDYTLDRMPQDPTLSPGNVQRAGQITWAVDYRPRFSQIRYQEVYCPGAIKITFEGGYATIPDDLVLAACLTVSQILVRRRFGFMVGNESWNRYSYGLAGIGLRSTDMLINGILGTPDIEALLNPYMNYAALIG